MLTISPKKEALKLEIKIEYPCLLLLYEGSLGSNSFSFGSKIYLGENGTLADWNLNSTRIEVCLKEGSVIINAFGSEIIDISNR